MPKEGLARTDHELEDAHSRSVRAYAVCCRASAAGRARRSGSVDVEGAGGVPGAISNTRVTACHGDDLRHIGHGKVSLTEICRGVTKEFVSADRRIVAGVRVRRLVESTAEGWKEMAPLSATVSHERQWRTLVNLITGDQTRVVLVGTTL